MLDHLDRMINKLSQGLEDATNRAAQCLFALFGGMAESHEQSHVT